MKNFQKKTKIARAAATQRLGRPSLKTFKNLKKCGRGRNRRRRSERRAKMTVLTRHIHRDRSPSRKTLTATEPKGFRRGGHFGSGEETGTTRLIRCDQFSSRETQAVAESRGFRSRRPFLVCEKRAKRLEWHIETFASTRRIHRAHLLPRKQEPGAEPRVFCPRRPFFGSGKTA